MYPVGGNDIERYARPPWQVSLTPVRIVLSLLLKIHHSLRNDKFPPPQPVPKNVHRLLACLSDLLLEYKLYLSGFTELTPLICNFLCFTAAGLLNRIPSR